MLGSKVRACEIIYIQLLTCCVEVVYVCVAAEAWEVCRADWVRAVHGRRWDTITISATYVSVQIISI